MLVIIETNTTVLSLHLLTSGGQSGMQTMMKWMVTNSPLDLSNFRPLGISSSHFTDWPATQEEILPEAACVACKCSQCLRTQDD